MVINQILYLILIILCIIVFNSIRNIFKFTAISENNSRNDNEIIINFFNHSVYYLGFPSSTMKCNT